MKTRKEGRRGKGGFICVYLVKGALGRFSCFCYMPKGLQGAEVLELVKLVFTCVTFAQGGTTSCHLLSSETFQEGTH